MIIKVELVEGRAYLLDDQGHIWELTHVFTQPYCELRLITVLSHEAVKSEMEPRLTRFQGRT